MVLGAGLDVDMWWRRVKDDVASCTTDWEGAGLMGEGAERRTNLAYEVWAAHENAIGRFREGAWVYRTLKLQSKAGWWNICVSSACGWCLRPREGGVTQGWGTERWQKPKPWQSSTLRGWAEEDLAANTQHSQDVDVKLGPGHCQGSLRGWERGCKGAAGRVGGVGRKHRAAVWEHGRGVDTEL